LSEHPRCYIIHILPFFTILRIVQTNVKSFDVLREFLFSSSHKAEHILRIITSEVYLKHKNT